MFDCVTVDASGAALVAGRCASGNSGAASTVIDAGGNNNSIPNGGYQSSFLAKFDAQGLYQWSLAAPGSAAGVAATVWHSLLSGPNGDFYAAGSYTLMAQSFGGQTPQLPAPDGQDGFVACFSPLGTVKWLTQIGGPGLQYVGSLVAAGAAEILAAGRTTNGLHVGSTNLPSLGGADGFVLALSTNGVLLSARSVGGPADDDVRSVQGTTAGLTMLAGQQNGGFQFAGKVITNAGAYILIFSESPPVFTVSNANYGLLTNQAATFSVATTNGTLREEFDFIVTGPFDHTTPALVPGNVCKITISGRASVGPNIGSPNSTPDVAYMFVNWQDLDVAHVPDSWICGDWDGIDNRRPFPDVYNTNHVYDYYVIGTGAGLAFSFRDNPYWDNAGGFHVKIFDLGPSADSVTPPMITTQPSNQMALVGQSVAFRVAATGSPLAFQWFKDGISLAERTNATLTIANVQPVNIGDYIVVITNSVGSVTSTVATLSIPNVPSGVWKGLVAYYPFDGNSNDESGNGYHATNVTAVPTVDRFGVPGQAYLFETGTNKIETTFPGISGGNPRTFTAWIKRSASLQTFPAFSYSIPGFYGHEFAGLFNRDGRVGVGVRTGNSEMDYSADFKTNSWEFYAWVLPARSTPATSDVQIFKNGLPVTSLAFYVNTAGMPVNTDLSHLILGGNWTVDSRIEPGDGIGAMDDIRSYNRALSSNDVFQLFASEAVPASIASQPMSQSVNEGATVTFSVAANGTAITYQWQLNGENILNATNSSFGIASTTMSQAGNYRVVITNAAGSLTSSTALLTVLPIPPRLATGVPVVDYGFLVAVNPVDGGAGYTNPPLVRVIGGGGTGAQVVAVVSNGVVTAYHVLDAGFGYTNPPLILVEPPVMPNPRLGIAAMSFLSFSNLALGGNYQMQRQVAWYWSNQPVNFVVTNPIYTQFVAGVADSGDYRLALNPVPSQAFATSQLSFGFMVAANVTSGGSGYVTAPAVTIVGGGGSNATAVAHLSGGAVTSLTVTDAGNNYTNPPTVRIAAPPAASVAPFVQPVMKLDATNLSPYDSYQLQFAPVPAGTWGNWGGPFSSTSTTNTQYLFITNNIEFFRLQYVP